MGLRGPKPKPTSLKVLNGARPARINKDEPKPTPGVPPVPAHLKGEALEEWKRITATLAPMNTLTQADGAALSIYCVAYSRWLEARKVIEERGALIDTTKKTTKKGTVINNPRGVVKTNPACLVAAEAEATMLRVLAAFGLTPSDRSKVKVERPTSKLDKFKVS